MMSSGRLRHRVRLEELTPDIDTSDDVIQDPLMGEVQRSWKTVGTYWASIEPLSTREFIQSQAVQSQVTGRIVMRKPARIDAAMRLVHMVNGVAGTIYNIHGILPDKESGLEYITCPVSTGVSNTGQ